MNNVQAYHVEWFVTDDEYTDVTVWIGDGRLLGVEQGRTPAAIELGSVALVAGLVNAHTHLEFSGMTSPIATTGRFTDWIRAVVAYRRQFSEEVRNAIGVGYRECVESGTTLIGDIATVGWSTENYSRLNFQGTVFQEVLGLSPERITGQKELAGSHVSVGDVGFSCGISPHAPYSTHLDLVREAVTLARRTGCPLAMHLAETEAEMELLANGTGEFREMLTEFGIWRDDLFPPGRRPMDYLQLLAESPRSLVVHGTYLDDDELKFIAANPRMTLVYCPRTHAALSHSKHPWRRARELGVRVALGTDSRASNPDLSLFTELQFLASQNPDVSHIELLQLGSIEGRRALGFEEDNQPNFTLIRLTDTASRTPASDLFNAKNQVCGTMINGHWAWIASDIQNVEG